jgi:hypothetical protein
MEVINPVLSISVNCASKAEKETMRKNFSFSPLGPVLKFQGFHKDPYCTMVFLCSSVSLTHHPKTPLTSISKVLMINLDLRQQK